MIINDTAIAHQSILISCWKQHINNRFMKCKLCITVTAV